ncbi:NAD-dependent succinate-semialdehyde dehydrogenase [Micavibrio aeruginosavorus]|uniref:Succinate-semialdehyde dehydrogenase family protein n=1 Tax=Micavibrio aeruginosavorus (strain ARL-13) TaxID=856793 RepID=G2KMR5_MICAA|nr:NAD-dependent succinate-semialdehyde dehydrogenase [Micavibrio aeruginosavorus]AEP08452.1 succinate-semialdehyde dehydrogenase family protein [Micavibrio aeruginosavorus ARL-13]
MSASYADFIRDRAFINGQWSPAHSDRIFAVTNPATGAVIGTVPDMGADETVAAIAAAKDAMPAWRKRTAKDRANIMRAWFNLIVEHADALAALLTAEQGKPLAEARGEIIYGASFVEWFAEEGKRIYGDTIPSHKTDARIMVTKEPIGVVGAITPWNFPCAMITRKIAPALAAGCTVVLKPAEDTPLSALALAVLAEAAGFPPGVINIVTGSYASAPAIGEVLTTHPDVRKISFTGSTEVGKILMRQSSSTVKRVSLELGGNAPFIVFDSANIDRAVDGAMACKFRNAGQTCVCANRIYVQDGVYDEFAKKLTAKVAALSVGSGDKDGVQIGPLINEDGIEKVKTHVADAVARGAKLVCGGNTHDAGPLFFEPTVLTNMTPDMLLNNEETFGPVAGLFRFTDEADAIALANDTRFGLASYFYTNDLAQAFRVAESLEYGMVAINEPILSTEVAPFGGVKESGMGREGSHYGVEDFVTVKYTLVGGL